MRQYPLTFSQLTGVCPHPRVEVIRNGKGEELGRICTLCVNLLSGVATCAGCGKQADIRLRIGDRLYCDDACKKAGEASRKKDARQPSRQTAWPWAAKEKAEPGARKRERKAT